ncbi:hypothetical protein FS837_005194 [Tulasnella sp. UAMH 9824]|nr:hypothetical protein FS837_005194 [Tulasnella sp. UAMH 9824]
MFGKTLFTRPARDLAATPTSQFQPEPAARHLFKRPFALLLRVRDVARLFRLSRSQEEVGDQQSQTSYSDSPSFGPSLDDVGAVLPARTGEEASATSTPSATFSATSCVRDLGTPPSISTMPTSAFASGPPSPQPLELHPDLIAVNQRIAELEALAEQTEQEHNDYVKSAREMEAALMALEEEVVSAVDAIKAVNKKTSLEDEENLKFDIERSRQIHYREIAEAFVEDAKRTYKEGQKKYADLLARFENLQREREQQRIDLKRAAPPSEPWLEVISTAVTPNILGGVAFGIGHIVGPLLQNSF